MGAAGQISHNKCKQTNHRIVIGGTLEIRRLYRRSAALAPPHKQRGSSTNGKKGHDSAHGYQDPGVAAVIVTIALGVAAAAISAVRGTGRHDAAAASALCPDSDLGVPDRAAEDRAPDRLVVAVL